MSLIFPDGGTYVAEINLPGIPGTILPAVMPDLDPKPYVIFNRIAFSTAEPARSAPSLSGTIYITALGEQPAQISISGVTFTCNCNKEGCQWLHNIDDVFEYFRTMRLSKSMSDVIVTIGSRSIRGYLVDMSLEGTSNQFSNQYHFNLTLISHVEFIS